MAKEKMVVMDTADVKALIDELEYLKLTLTQDLKPTANKLDDIHKNLHITIENFDKVLENKTSEVLNKIDINVINKEVVQEVLKKFDEPISQINELSYLSSETIKLVEIFQKNNAILEDILSKQNKMLKKIRLYHASLTLEIWIYTFAFLGVGIAGYMILKMLGRI